MKKIQLVSTFLVATITFSFAQNTHTIGEKMIVFPSFAQLPQENQEIVLVNELDTKQESILEIKKDNLNTKIEEEKLKMAGYLLKKGGDQIMTGGIISATSVAIALILFVASGTNTASSSRSSTNADPAIALAGSVIGLAGIISGSVLRISGGSNIKKAGKILLGEPTF